MIKLINAFWWIRYNVFYFKLWKVRFQFYYWTVRNWMIGIK
jgi:hypothetical protein